MLRAQPLSRAAGVGTRLRHEPLQRVGVGLQVSIEAPQPQDPPHVAAVPHRHTGVVRQGLRCRLRRGGGGCSVGTNGAAAVGGVQVSEERVSELPLGPQNREPDGHELPQREQQPVCVALPYPRSPRLHPTAHHLRQRAVLGAGAAGEGV